MPAPLSVHADLTFRGPAGGGVVRGRGRRITARFDSWGSFWALAGSEVSRRLAARGLALTNRSGLHVYLSLPGVPTLRLRGWALYLAPIAGLVGRLRHGSSSS